MFQLLNFIALSRFLLISVHPNLLPTTSFTFHWSLVISSLSVKLYLMYSHIHATFPTGSSKFNPFFQTHLKFYLLWVPCSAVLHIVSTESIPADQIHIYMESHLITSQDLDLDWKVPLLVFVTSRLSSLGLIPLSVSLSKCVKHGGCYRSLLTAALASPGNLFYVQNLRPQSRFTESLSFKKISRWSQDRDVWEALDEIISN